MPWKESLQKAIGPRIFLGTEEMLSTPHRWVLLSQGGSKFNVVKTGLTVNGIDLGPIDQKFQNLQLV